MKFETVYLVALLILGGYAWKRLARVFRINKPGLPHNPIHPLPPPRKP